MKGVIVNCLRDLVTNKFGKDKWEAVLEDAGFDKSASFLVTQNIRDEEVMKLIGSICKVQNITLLDAADAFGEHWSCTYAPNIYKPYYRGATSAREFLLKLDEIHRMTTESIPDAKPPRFEYSCPTPNTLLMKYKSHRSLIDFLVGLVKGVGKYFREDLQVTKQDNNTIKVVFS